LDNLQKLKPGATRFSVRMEWNDDISQVNKPNPALPKLRAGIIGSTPFESSEVNAAAAFLRSCWIWVFSEKSTGFDHPMRGRAGVSFSRSDPLVNDQTEFVGFKLR
jgi:hypothetical protein